MFRHAGGGKNCYLELPESGKTGGIKCEKIEQGIEGVHPRYRRLDLFGVPWGALILPWPPNLALITGPRKSGLSLSLSTSLGNEITSCALSMPEPNVKPIDPGLLAGCCCCIEDN